MKKTKNKKQKLPCSDIIGKYLYVAEVMAMKDGYTVRVGMLDGVPLALTCEYNPSRLNVEVENSKVKAILSIG